MHVLFSYCSLDCTKSAILPELVELTNDEESYVRIAGLETVVNILTLLDDGNVCAVLSLFTSPLAYTHLQSNKVSYLQKEKVMN